MMSKFMEVQEVMQISAGKNCSIKSECKKESDRVFFENLFDTDWEVFVAKRDSNTGQFNWTTACCVAATAEDR